MWLPHKLVGRINEFLQRSIVESGSSLSAAFIQCIMCGTTDITGDNNQEMP